MDHKIIIIILVKCSFSQKIFRNFSSLPYLWNVDLRFYVTDAWINKSRSTLRINGCYLLCLNHSWIGVFFFFGCHFWPLCEMFIVVVQFATYLLLKFLEYFLVYLNHLIQRVQITDQSVHSFKFYENIKRVTSCLFFCCLFRFKARTEKVIQILISVHSIARSHMIYNQKSFFVKDLSNEFDLCRSLKQTDNSCHHKQLGTFQTRQ